MADQVRREIQLGKLKHIQNNRMIKEFEELNKKIDNQSIILEALKEKNIAKAKTFLERNLAEHVDYVHDMSLTRIVMLVVLVYALYQCGKDVREAHGGRAIELKNKVTAFLEGSDQKVALLWGKTKDVPEKDGGVPSDPAPAVKKA